MFFPRYVYRRRPLTWIVASIVFTVLIIVSASITFGFTATSDYTSDDGLHYAPTDTRIIPVSGTFCQGLKLRVDKSLSGYTASLYMLDSRPELTGNETFSINASTYLDDYVYYYYYLYPGSSFTVSSCIDEDTYSSVSFYLIKGHGHYDQWVDSFHTAPTEDTFTISASCSNGTSDVHTYHIDDEDYYYLVFDSHYLELKMHMTFYRTRYELPPTTSGDSCTVYADYYDDSCSVGVPLSSKTAFLVVAPRAYTEVDWTEGIGLDTKCVARVWMYVVICLSCLIGLLLILVPLLACIIIKCCKKKATPTVTAVQSDNAPLLTANPHLQQPPPYGYGSNYTAPPLYNP